MFRCQERKRFKRTALQPVQFIKQATPYSMLSSLPSGVIRTFDSNPCQCTPKKKKIILQSSPKRFRPISPVLSRNKIPHNQICRQRYFKDKEFCNCYSPSRMRTGFRDYNSNQQSYQYDLNREYCCNVQKTYPQYFCQSQNTTVDKYSSKKQILCDLQRLKKKIYQMNI